MRPRKAASVPQMLSRSRGGTDPVILNKASASVVLVGVQEYEMIQKSIKLDQPDQRTGRCCGSADFGLLKDALAKLGTELGLVVFMVVSA
jgi:hypothetical protein